MKKNVRVVVAKFNASDRWILSLGTFKCEQLSFYSIHVFKPLLYDNLMWFLLPICLFHTNYFTSIFLLSCIKFLGQIVTKLLFILSPCQLSFKNHFHQTKLSNCCTILLILFLFYTPSMLKKWHIRTVFLYDCNIIRKAQSYYREKSSKIIVFHHHNENIQQQKNERKTCVLNCIFVTDVRMCTHTLLPLLYT